MSGQVNYSASPPRSQIAEAPFSGFQFLNLKLEAGQWCQHRESNRIERIERADVPDGGSLQDCIKWYRQLKELV